MPTWCIKHKQKLMIDNPMCEHNWNSNRILLITSHCKLGFGMLLCKIQQCQNPVLLCPLHASCYLVQYCLRRTIPIDLELSACSCPAMIRASVLSITLAILNQFPKVSHTSYSIWWWFIPSRVLSSRELPQLFSKSVGLWDRHKINVWK